jgi:hypothetical protein
MIRNFPMFMALGIVLGACSGLHANEAGTPPANEPPSSVCSRDVRARDVLVLDIQHLVRKPDEAGVYVLEQAGEYRLDRPLIREFKTRTRPSKDPKVVTRAAQKLAVRQGCDLVLVLDTGPYFGRQRSRNARMKDGGYALVAMGQRFPSSP